MVLQYSPLGRLAQSVLVFPQMVLYVDMSLCGGSAHLVLVFPQTIWYFNISSCGWSAHSVLVFPHQTHIVFLTSCCDYKIECLNNVHMNHTLNVRNIAKKNSAVN